MANNINIKDANRNTKVLSTQDDGGVHTPATMQYPYKKIHEGKTFVVRISDTSLANGNDINIYLKTPDTTSRIHVVPIAFSSVAGELEILEAPTVTAGTGTALTVFNRNRNNSTPSIIIDNTAPEVTGRASETVTITGDGTSIFTETLGTGNKNPGESRDINEFILAQNTVYVFRLTSNFAGNSVYLSLNYYEL